MRLSDSDGTGQADQRTGQDTALFLRRPGCSQNQPTYLYFHLTLTCRMSSSQLCVVERVAVCGNMPGMIERTGRISSPDNWSGAAVTGGDFRQVQVGDCSCLTPPSHHIVVVQSGAGA